MKEFSGSLRDGWSNDSSSKKSLYESSVPYKHVVLSPFQDEFVERLKQELLSSLPTTFKETDLFRVNQTVDFANLRDDPSSAITQMKRALYSPQFRHYIEQVTQCGKLNSRVDCAANVYSQGCHLLCHDDCISSRRISYILYLSDQPWSEECGGALELYPQQQPGHLDTTSSLPSTCILPLFATMCVFHVKAGHSVHSVQEVLSKHKRRISVQGWFHSDEPVEHRERATISHLTGIAPHNDFFLSHQKSLSRGADLQLDQWINQAYLTDQSALSIAKALVQRGSVVLCDFFLPQTVKELMTLAASCDDMDELGHWRRPAYDSGIGRGWQVTGPPHVRRFCQYVGPKDEEESASLQRSKLGRVGHLMRQLQHVIVSDAFVKRFLSHLNVDKDAESEVRRFRPGLDYTVAQRDHHHHHDDGEKASAETSKRSKSLESSSVFATWTFVENDASWETGDLGAHHIFMSESEDAESAARHAEVYVADDGGDGSELISISPQANALSLVLCNKPNMMQFVQYVSGGAVSSRWDICTRFPLSATTSSEVSKKKKKTA